MHTKWSVHSEHRWGSMEAVTEGLTMLAQTWSVLSYFNLAPTSLTSDLNVVRARLIYGLVSQMDMNLGNMISGQITQIAQSNTSLLGFSMLITTLCDIQWVTSDTLTFESLSLVINLAYIWENCWNLADPSIIFPSPSQSRSRRSSSPSTTSSSTISCSTCHHQPAFLFLLNPIGASRLDDAMHLSWPAPNH